MNLIYSCFFASILHRTNIDKSNFIIVEVLILCKHSLLLLLLLLKWMNVIQDTQKVLKLPQEQRA